MYNYLQPVTASLIAVAASQETFGPVKALAMLLVFLGVWFVSTSGQKKTGVAIFSLRKGRNDSFAVVTDIVAEEVNIQCRPSCEFLVGDIKQFAPDRFSVIFDRFFSHSLTSRYFSRVVFTLRRFA